MDEAQADADTVAETDVDAETLRTVPEYREYWRRNLKLIASLFLVWFAVSFLAAILLAEPLAGVQLGQIPLSFWFAQQGSIMVFVALIFVYAWRMNKLDREYGVED